MPRKSSIDAHPLRDDIVAAISLGDETAQEIALRYDIGRGSVHRYRERLEVAAGTVLPAAITLAQERTIQDGAGLLERIQITMERVQRMYDAFDEYLRDPEDPQKYAIGPDRLRESKLLLDTANTLNKQLELMAKLWSTAQKMDVANRGLLEQDRAVGFLQWLETESNEVRGRYLEWMRQHTQHGHT